MYTVGKSYKIQLKGNRFYTGKVLQEDSIQIKFLSKFNEELIINKDSIVQSILLNDIVEKAKIGGQNE